jgi:four helix bundle protein
MGRFKDRNLMDRVFKFVIEVLRLWDKVPKNSRNLIILDHLMRSSTSTGANLEEADGAISRKEFIKFVNTSKREMKEANYWLRILQVFESEKTSVIQPLIKESGELASIFYVIVQNSIKNKQ